MTTPPTPQLTGIVVHWHDEDRLAELVAAWPGDEGLELVIVDNGSKRQLPTQAWVLTPAGNLGFAGAVNLGLQATRAPLVLIMNSDVCPQPGALAALVRAGDRWPGAAALAPRLVGTDGASQYSWQLRSLPTVATLVLQCLFLPVTGERRAEPRAGEPVEQPAAAALCVRRQILDQLGGFDEAFYPAWFEDVDLAKRMKSANLPIRYCPDAEFVHHLGSSIPLLGYGSFLRSYYANLCRYLGKHHGRFWASTARLLLIPAALLRLAWLPIRCPKRARSRRQAASGLWGLALDAASGWRRASADSSPDTSSLDRDGGQG